MKKITVFTPTFNRAYTLHKCYESLKKQKNKNFEWMIIDDGSTDNTENLIKKWQKKNIMSIKYIYKKNGGMHSGYNVAYNNIFTELAVCIDSDDYMTENAIEDIITFWDCNKKEDIAGIVGLNITEKGKLIGKKLPNKERVKIYDYYNRLGGTGDKKMIYRPEVIRSFISPEFEGEKLFPTCYKYFMVDLEYDMLILNKPLCIVEYMRDGFTQNIIKQYKKNLKSFIFYRKFIMEYPNATKFHKFKFAIHYVAECLLAKEKKWLKNIKNKMLVLLAYPFGFLLYIYLLRKG